MAGWARCVRCGLSACWCCAQGLVQSAFLWGYMATPLLGGVLADKYGGEPLRTALPVCAPAPRVERAGGPGDADTECCRVELLHNLVEAIIDPFRSECRQEGDGLGHRLVLGCLHGAARGIHTSSGRPRPSARSQW